MSQRDDARLQAMDPGEDAATSSDTDWPGTFEVPPGGSFDLRVHPVTKRIGDDVFPMLSYNGSIPGPTLRVRQGSQIHVTITNETDMDTTVHWHGLRLENRYDGVPHETQKPIPPGGTYTHVLSFPDPGTYWYHPHVREDYAQEMGLYGNIIVEPEDPDYWPRVDREVVLTLDDILIEGGQIAPFGSDGPNFAAMGRFGNVFLISGETDRSIVVRRGDRVRFLLTNTANTRVFKVTIPQLRMKLVGGDSGRYEREQWLSDVVIAPSERVIVDIVFEQTGSHRLEHHTPERVYRLADIEVRESSRQAARLVDFDTLRIDSDLVAGRARIAPWLDAPPDKTLALVAEIGMPDSGEPSQYSCPMHPEVVSDQPGTCPICGMKLMPVPSGMGESHGHVSADEHGAEEMTDGIEWEDFMLEFNRMTTPTTIRWILVDRDSGERSPHIDWTFRVGDQVKIRLVNEMTSDHPMHHPFHIHGQRFLILARDGAVEPNLVWKDTVLVRTGQIVDILMDASNPGLWMAHCHIPEHMGSGMMFSFRVDR